MSSTPSSVKAELSTVSVAKQLPFTTSYLLYDLVISHPARPSARNGLCLCLATRGGMAGDGRGYGLMFSAFEHRHCFCGLSLLVDNCTLYHNG
jgi:hypothetical protein